VGADLDAGADFPQLARLLAHLDIDAALEQGERRGQSADAGADNQDASRRAHKPLRAGWVRVSTVGQELIGNSRLRLSPPRSSAEFRPRQKPRNLATSRFWTRSRVLSCRRSSRGIAARR